MQVELRCRNKRKMQLQPRLVRRCQKLSGNTIITAQINTQDMDIYADSTLQLKCDCSAPGADYQESIYPRENYIVPRQTSSSPSEISAHFLFNKVLPGKTTFLIMRGCRVWPLSSCLLSEALFDEGPSMGPTQEGKGCCGP